LIAATAIIGKFRIATRNKNHYPDKSLLVGDISWSVAREAWSGVLRWRRCHEVTEVDKGLPDCNFDEHYGYTKKLPPPAPAGGGHDSRFPLHERRFTLPP